MDFEEMSREQLLDVLRGLQHGPLAATPGQADAVRLLHELQVHQVELEIQNRELRDAQGALEESRNRYADLYDFAPVAYITLSSSGIVEELNLTGATLLRVERHQAQGRPFSSLVTLDQPRQFWHHLGQCAALQGPVVSELALSVGGRSIEVEAVSVPVLGIGKRASSFRTAFTDITRRKQAERERECAHASEQQLRQRLQAMDEAHMELATRLARKSGALLDDLVEIVTRRARTLVRADLASFEFGGTDQPDRASWIEGLNPNIKAHQLEIDLEYAGETLGTLKLVRAALEAPFSEHDRETLRMFAQRVASALQIARLSAVEARESARLWVLERVGRELSRAHDRAGAVLAIGKFLDGAVERFCDAALLYVREDEAIVLAHATAQAAARDGVGRLSGPELVGPVAAFLGAAEEPALQLFQAGQEGEDAGTLLGKALMVTLQSRCLVLAPLLARGQSLGLICLSRGPERPAFTRAELAWSDEIAARCSLSLDNARLFEELRAALDWRETLLASISHDLKSPLSAISLSASALVRDEPMPERRKTGRQVDLIRRSADHMHHMVNDLLLENMLNIGTFQLELGRHGVLQLVADACQLAEPLAAARNVSLAQHVEKDLPDVSADRERVLRVFANLIGNAAKFSPHGATVRVDARRGQGCVEFSVTDSGPGIALDQQAQLFKRYWRGSKGPRGLGLGLYIAKSIVEAHGGAITVASTAGAGATFTFSVPFAAR